MLEIHQRKDTQEYSGYLKNCNLDNKDALVIEAFDKGKVTGFCIFTYGDDCVNLYYVEYGEDVYLFDGLIRTVLFKASLKGIDKAVYFFENKGNFELLEKFRTVDKGMATLSSIQNVMNGCKNCKKI